MHIFRHTNIDFLRWRWYAIGLSWAIILAGVFVIATTGLPKGVEFSGGTIVILKFDRVPDQAQVRAALDKAMPGQGSEAIIQRYGDVSANQLMIRVASVGAESGTSLSSAADRVLSALKAANMGDFRRQCTDKVGPPCYVGTEIVGPIVGRELTQKGILATVLSLVGILLYIAFRYQFSFGVGAVIATIHDLLVTFAFLAFFRYDLSLNVIAAILTVTGYSTNDTIVIFDRVRENLRSMRRDNLEHVINVSVNQTLSRTIITAGTALLSALALFFFGGEVLHGFAFTMIVGIITGTYSSVFIAAAIAVIWQGRKPVKTAPAAAQAPAPAVDRKPASTARKRRRA